MIPTNMPQAVDTLGQIATRSNNDAIVMAAIIAIVVVALLLPLYFLYTKRDKEKLSQYIQREDRILKVIENNGESNIRVAEANTKVAEAITSLKVTMDMTSKHCDTCKGEQMQVLHDISSKQDDSIIMLTKLMSIYDRRNNNENS